QVLGDLNISTGASIDTVTITDADFGRGTQRFHSAVLETGAGADTVFIDDIGAIGNFRITSGLDSERDVDTVTMNHAFVSQNLTMYPGAGDDVLSMFQVRAGDDMVLYGQLGNDTMKLTEVEALDGFYAVMDDGNDTLDLTFVKAQSMLLDGGTG